MKLNSVLSTTSSPARLAYLLMFALVGAILFSLLGFVLIFFFQGMDVMNVFAPGRDLSDPGVSGSLKLFQILSSIGTFVFPALLAAVLFNNTSWTNYLSLKRVSDFRLVFVAVFAMLTALPVVNYLGWLNGQMNFPESLKFVEDWMREMEESNQNLIEQLLVMKTPIDFALNLFMIAIVPAVGEELLFRGVLQKELIKWFKNKHVGIWLSAIIFSAIHFQFLGFIPRMMMGALFGYVLSWTGSLRLPIIMHFINNGIALGLVFLIDLNKLPEETEDIGALEGQWPGVLFAFSLCVVLLALIKRMGKAEKKADIE
ncbi:MAG: hypothetical protein CL843_03005 [Crocinitomicaceae bacterium]|nr:hypothetical protein [Crocinitomicaceae bacterium]|tara:strand:+ start:5474 stop:6415 length:942 start_codon:yes stop_codon:yes gene_type:complete